jgi:hypothetical protein
MISQPDVHTKFDFWFPSCCRYWSATAQSFATGDQLLYYLKENWELETRVEMERYFHGPGRYVVLYHVVLQKESRRVMMPVIGGPFMRELLYHNPHLKVVPVRPARAWASRVRRRHVPHRSSAVST